MADTSVVAKSVHNPSPKPTIVSHGATKICEDGETRSASKGRAENGESCRNRVVDDDKWKISLLPRFQGIDERADEFIAKFRNDMKLEREQSIREFEEMLKRSA
ncbi:hypothetical protein AAHA92_05645 [Salvia divinorum]